MIHRYPTDRRRGVAAVEMAFCLPFIMILLLGLWEVGRMIEIQQILSNAAREGGRAAATGQYTNAQVQTIVTNYLKVAGLPTANVVVTPVDVTTGGDVGSANYLDTVQVTVTIPFSDVRWSFLSTIVPASTILTAQSVWVSMVDKTFQGFAEPPVG
jgi:Flp pilus assembly protein TadG